MKKDQESSEVIKRKREAFSRFGSAFVLFVLTMKVNYLALWAPLLALSTASDDERAKTCSHGLLKQGGAINIGIVIDNSGSTVTLNLHHGSNVGDVNGDGKSNTILDAEIASVLALLDEIKNDDELSNDNVDIGLIIFSTIGEYEGIYKPLSNDNTAVNPDLVAKLKSITAPTSYYCGWTNFDDALDKSIEFFSDDQLVSGRKNLMVFLSDGKPNVRGDGDVSILSTLYISSSPTLSISFF
jgi:hypothetical protein